MAKPEPEPSQITPTISTDLLTRLTSKPGIKSTLILSTTDGSILQATGQLAIPISQQQQQQFSEIDPPASPSRLPSQAISGEEGKGRTAEDIARAVFTFVDQAKVFADEILGEKSLGAAEQGKKDNGEKGAAGSTGENVRLLRLRTRREEIVIYPEAKFLLVVVQDAPVS